MPQHELQFHQDIAAPIERVFEFLADHHHFASLFGGSCTVIREGDDRAEPQGCGSVRRLGPGPLSFDETIVAFDRPNGIDYVISRGSPIKNHRGTVRLQRRGDHTVLDYRIVFDGRLPGTGALVAQALQLAWKLHAPKRLRSLEG